MLVYHGKFFDLVAMKALACLFESCSYRDGHEIFARHQLRNRTDHVRLKTNVAVGKNPHKFSVFGNWNTRNMEALHGAQCFL